MTQEANLSNALPRLVFSCGALDGKCDEEVLSMLDDTDAQSIRPWYFGIGKDVDPTLTPYNLGDLSRADAPIQNNGLNITWSGENISPGTRLDYIAGELGEEGVYLSDFNTHVGKSNHWYWNTPVSKNYNIIVNNRGGIISTRSIFNGDLLVKKK